MNLSKIAQRIWDEKYRFKRLTDNGDFVVVDKTLQDTWGRVARALASAELPSVRDHYETEFFKAMEDFKVLPAGRIIAGAGTGRQVTLMNCFVNGDIPDDLAGIFEHLKEAAITMQQGGGIGYDFSTLRPKGAPVRGVEADASGPISFMDVWDSMCRTIMSAGTRRGAMMATMRCDHPDIEAFIDAKQDAGRLRMFNLSVLCTDPFMDAVGDGRAFDLVFGGKVYKTIHARDLWDRIMRATYAAAEPGVIFIDQINHRNNLHYCETIRSTNPCGEQPLPPYGTCLLGSLNLARLVREPFTREAHIKAGDIEDLVTTAVRMLDNVIDISGYPHPKQRQEAFDKRRIGLGVTGLADALAMCGVRYGSSGAITLTSSWMTLFECAAYRASAMLAKEKGRFPLFIEKEYLEGVHIKHLPTEIRELIHKHGIRNALLTSIAPTGTISLFADNPSSGIEPIFDFGYSRTILKPDGSKDVEQVMDYAVRLYEEANPIGPLPPAFVTAAQLTPADHLGMQAVVQEHIDSSISKTINLPENITFESFKDIYRQAYLLGCKGCTTYRPNDITGSILSSSSMTMDEAVEPTGTLPDIIEPITRGDVVPGETYKLTWPESEHALYLTINDVVVDGIKRPIEVFVNSKNMEHFTWTVALTRMISAIFRQGGDVAFVAEELKNVFDPRGGAWIEKKYVPSIVALIGEKIEDHLRKIGWYEDVEAEVMADKAVAFEDKHRELTGRPGDWCPKCHRPTLVHKEGCAECTGCDYSKCS